MKFTYASGSRPLDGYTIKRGIGQGGFGEVYYATSDGGKEVALKLVRRNLSVEVRGVRHCLNLKHPNLVGLYDIRQDNDGDTWVVMEYLGGDVLEDVIARSPGGLPEAEALAWFRDICAGVIYLHDRGIVHRDLKPGNIFRDEGIVKIGDYGLSKFISASRRSGQTESVGTVHYMAPEVANGRYGKEIDVYALGIMLYELLTGRVPFDGESVGEVLMKHLTAQPDLNTLNEPYRSLVGRCLEKDPAKRLSSVAELVAALPDGGDASAARPSARAAAATMAWAAGDDQTATADNGNATPHAAATPSGTARMARLPLEYSEPVFRWVSGATQRAWTAWLNSNLGIVPKMIVLIIGLLVVITLSSAVLPVLIVCAVFYCLYLVGYVLLFGGFGAPAAASRSASASASAPDSQPASDPSPPPIRPAAQVSAPPPPPGRHRRHQRHPGGRGSSRSMRLAAFEELMQKPTRERVTELLGSMLLSALVVTAATAVLSALNQAFVPEQFAWYSLAGTLGSWALLVPAKIWEPRAGERLLRGLSLLAIGLVVGAASFGLYSGLTVEMDNNSDFAAGEFVFVDFDSPPDGSPIYPTFMAYFALLFAVPRWWRQAHPLRGTRLSVWSTAGVVLWAWLLGLFWDFPQPWGMIVAGIISVAVQISSPWIDTRPDWSRQVA